MEIPNWLKCSMKPQDFDKVEEAIHRAELRTSAEIVPVVVKSSSVFGHVPVILNLIGWVVGLALDRALMLGWEFNMPFWADLVYIGLVFVLSAILAPRPWIQRWVTAREDLALQVYERAELEFYHSKINTTSGATGLLIFVSMMEHQVVVLADKAIADRNPPETWQKVVSKVISGIKEKDLAAGLINGIELSAQILEKDYPRKEGDQNELPNHLVIKV